MPDLRQNFNLPYPIICKIIEKIDGDDGYNKLAKTCKFMQKMCYRQQILNMPSKILHSILRKLSPVEIFDMALTSKYMWNLTRDICKRQVNVLSVDEYSHSEIYFVELSQHLVLSINHKGYKALVKNIIVTDILEIYSADTFKPSLRKALNMPILRFKKLDITGCNISKDDLAYFLHPRVVEFIADNIKVIPGLKFEELLEMLKNVEIMRIDISNLKFTPNIEKILLEWKREKPIESFAFMRLPKTFQSHICIDFIEKFGGIASDFSLSFFSSPPSFHEKYHTKVQTAIDKAQAEDRSHKGLAGVARWRCEKQVY